MIELYVGTIMYSLKIYNITISEKYLGRFYNKLKVYTRTVNIQVKETGIIRKEAERTYKKHVAKETSTMAIKTRF